MATIEEIHDVFEALCAAYPGWGRDAGVIMNKTIQVYEQTLKDIHGGTLKMAALHHISMCKWFPTVAELRSAAVALSSRNGHRAGAEAWGDVLHAMHEFGFYRKPQFDDPTVARIVASFGWRELCQSENSIADRARFIEAYEQIANREKERDTMLPEVRQLVDRLTARWSLPESLSNEDARTLALEEARR